MSSWSDTVIWWQVYPLGFVGAEKSALPAGSPVQHRLSRLEPWLDYVIELGCNGLALNPIFSSESHGYDIVDHRAVDPRLGDDADVDALIDACHRRGIRVLFDGVFNHVGRGFPGFVDLLENRQDSRWVSWFDIDWDADGYDGFEYRKFEGHGGLVALDHSSAAVEDYVVSIMEYWLGRGVDGWRLDAAYAVPLPFWRTVTDRVRDRFPDAWFVGEVIHGDFPDWVSEGGLDSVTEYELWKATWSSMNDGNFYELAWTIDRHRAFSQAFVPLTFLGNHDTTRIASQLNDIRHLGHALAVLFTLPGIPAVYYGDEQAFRGVKEDREGGDDEVRPAFPAGPDDLAPDGWPTYRMHQGLIGLRRRESWLTTADTEVVHLANEQLSYRVFDPAATDDRRELLVLLNIGDEAFAFPLATSGQIELSGDTEGPRPALADGQVTVGGHDWAVVRVDG